MLEVELKFQVSPASRADLAAALTLTAARRSRLQASYFDTADGRLALGHVSLRLRKEGRVWVQTLKAPGDSAVQRLEHNVPRPGRWGDDGPPLDPALHEGTAAGDALRRAWLSPQKGEDGDGAAPPLQVVYRADVRRRIRLAEHDGSTIELALDEGELRAGEHTAPVSELEFELKQGAAAALVSFARQAVEGHGLWLSVIPKAARGERLAQGRAHGEPVRAEAATLSRRMSAAGLQRAVLAACLAQVLGNASEIADGCRGDEHIHQLRVGLRRLRTVLRELADLAPGLDPGWEAPLAAAFAELGEVRDRDTVGGAVADQLRAAGAPPIVLPPPAQAAADPVQTVRAALFQAVLLDLLAYTLADDEAPSREEDGEGAPPPKPRKAVRAKLARLHRQVARDGARFDELDEDHQHRVRKRLKRLRYLAELVADLFEPKAVKRYLSQLRPAQDALGDHNDTWVALAMYRQAAQQGRAEAWFAVGWLQARLPLTVKACGKALAKVSSAERFW